MESVGRTISRSLLFLGVVSAVFLSFDGGAFAADVSMRIQDLGRGEYRLEGHIKVEAPEERVWQVLTDYKHIPDFVSSMRKSNIKEYRADQILVEQEASVKVFLFSRRVHILLRVVEEPYNQISFEDISHKDFSFYQGSWRLHKEGSGFHIVYRLQCRRRFMSPNFIARDVLKKNAELLLTEVRAEILRRQRGGSHEN